MSFRTYKRAAQAANTRAKKANIRLYVYKCPNCRRYHMTKQNRG